MDVAGLDRSVQGAGVNRRHIRCQSSGMVKVLGRQGAPSSSSQPPDSPQKNAEPAQRPSSPQVGQSLSESAGRVKHTRPS